jgi:hypothetical protein
VFTGPFTEPFSRPAQRLCLAFPKLSIRVSSSGKDAGLQSRLRGFESFHPCEALSWARWLRTPQRTRHQTPAGTDSRHRPASAVGLVSPLATNESEA